MKNPERASILIEALPYIRAFYGKIFVIKYGGHAMVEEELKASFTQDLILMKYVGINPVVVHGGGPQIEKVLERMGIKSHFFHGMRITNDEIMDVVEMVLMGKLNKEIVTLINQQGGRAVGICGKDGMLIRAKKMDSQSLGISENIDLGKVGIVEAVDPTVIQSLDRDNFIPVIAPIGVGAEGETYNINADLVAGKLASALKAEKLILLTDVEGILSEKGDLIPDLELGEVKKLLEQGKIWGGMVPKVKCCIQALEEGIKKAHIIDGRKKHALLLEVFTDRGIGTQIFRKE